MTQAREVTDAMVVSSQIQNTEIVWLIKTVVAPWLTGKATFEAWCAAFDKLMNELPGEFENLKAENERLKETIADYVKEYRSMVEEPAAALSPPPQVQEAREAAQRGCEALLSSPQVQDGEIAMKDILEALVAIHGDYVPTKLTLYKNPITINCHAAAEIEWHRREHVRLVAELAATIKWYEAECAANKRLVAENEGLKEYCILANEGEIAATHSAMEYKNLEDEISDLNLQLTAAQERERKVREDCVAKINIRANEEHKKAGELFCKEGEAMHSYCANALDDMAEEIRATAIEDAS